MRTIISILAAAAISVSAQGAVVSEYWFDTSIDDRKTEQNTEFVLDLSTLPKGIHTLNYRVCDDLGAYSALHSHMFYVGALDIGKASKVNAVEYWLDNAPANRVTADTTAFVLELDQLPRGLHTLNYRVCDDLGIYSALHKHLFFASAPASDKASAVTDFEYWWDNDPANALTAKLDSTSAVFTFDCVALEPGLHSISYQIKDDKGRRSPASRHFFFKNYPSATSIKSYTYWWNDCIDKAVSVELENPTAEFVLSEELTLPAYARTNYAGHYTATLNFAFTDDLGRQSATYSTNISYPDSDAPVTEIDADDYAPYTQVKLTWIEKTDDDVASYNVYVSDNGGVFLLWKADTTDTTAIFKGESGHRYRITVTAVDTAGNREAYDESKCISVTFK